MLTPVVAPGAGRIVDARGGDRSTWAPPTPGIKGNRT
jgi:hypothetical protein